VEIFAKVMHVGVLSNGKAKLLQDKGFQHKKQGGIFFS
jgi:hypothetical protein